MCARRYSTSGCYDQGTWGVLPEETYDISNTVSLWMGSHTLKAGGSFTYDVTKQLFAPLQNGVYRFSGSPSVAPTPFQFDQAFALTPEARLMFPRAYVVTSFIQDDWRVRNNLTLNLGLRYDVELIRNIPDYPAPTDKDNLDPRVGFAWDPKGDQKWAVRGGFGSFTQQHPIFTIVKGGVGGRNGLVTLNLTPGNPLFPTFPNAIASLPTGTVLPIRSIQEISPTLENERAWTANVGFQRQLGARSSVSVDANLNRGQKHGFLDTNAPATVPKEVLIAANGASVRTVAQADLTRPTLPVPNGFRRVEVLTNEGRFWYQGIRFSANPPHDAADDAGVVHVVEGGRSPQSLVPARGQQRSRARSRTDGRRYAAQPGRRGDLEPARRALAGEGLAAERRDALAERVALHDPLRGAIRPARSSRSAARAAARRRGPARATPRAARTSTTPTSPWRARFGIGRDRIEFRADVFNVFNNWNLIADGFVATIGSANFGQHTGGSNVFPGRQFQFAVTYRF